MKKVCKIGIATVILAIFMFAMSLQVFAKDFSLCDENIYIEDNASSSSLTGTTYTATAKGSILGAKSVTITIYNYGVDTATIKFGYSSLNAATFTIGGKAVGASGDFSALLEPDGSFDIELKSGWNSTAELKLTNIEYITQVASSNVVFEFDSELGTVTVGGSSITSGDERTIEASAPAEICAVPVSGAVFVGWINAADNKMISKDATYQLQSEGDMTVKALFSDKVKPYFLVDGKYIYDNLNNALDAGTNLVLMCDAVFGAGEYIIPAGKTLMIPFDANNTMYDISKFPVGVQGYKTPSPYRTLTLKAGAEIIVNGALNVCANQSSSQGSTALPTGPCAFIAMEEESAITVNNGGILYAWGYITGSGNITAKSGATVYENFQVEDYRGGSAISLSMVGKSERVFPMSQYYVQNIEVPLTLESGATENGYMTVFVSNILGDGGTINGAKVPFIGSGGMFNITSGSIVKDYDESTDRLIIDVNGTLAMQSISISMKIMSIGGPTTIDSASYVLPVNGNITLNLNSGSADITQDIALLPGGIINVGEAVTCTFSSDARVFIYDSDDWGGYCYKTNEMFIPLAYAPGRQKGLDRTKLPLTDATVNVAGTIDATGGFAYSTQNGAAVHGVDGAKVMLRPGTDTITYQASQNVSEITYVKIPVTTAYLKNNQEENPEVDLYTDPEYLMNCCTTYEYSNGEWVPQNVTHTGLTAVEAKASTCTETGWEAYEYCTACEYNTTYEEIPALGHNEVSHEGKTATCTESGCEAYVSCTRCDYTTYEEIPALGHSYGEWTADGAQHKKICANNSDHIIIEEHEFEEFICIGCGCEKRITSTIYSIVDGNIELDTSLILDVDEDAYIITATYDRDGKLLNVAFTKVAELDKVILSSADVAKVRVLVWSDLILKKPLSLVEEIIL